MTDLVQISKRRITGIDPTGSTYDRVVRCTASAALPQVFDAGESEHRDRGTAIHEFLEAVATHVKAGVPHDKARDTAIAALDEQWRDVCAGVELAKLGDRLQLSTEVAVAYNWRNDTARYLQPIEKRLYEIDVDNEIAMTLDLAGVSGREVFAGDYKGPYAWLPDPRHSMQLGVGALALARIHKARSAKVEYIRILSNGQSRRFDAELDVFGLDGVAQAVTNMMTDVEQLRVAINSGVIPNVTEGPYCSYCPAKRYCPAKTAMVRSLLDAKPISLREPITPQNASQAYAVYKKAKEAIAVLESAIHIYAGVGEVSTPDFTAPDAIACETLEDGSVKYFGNYARPGNEVLDGAITHQVITAMYGAAAANKAVTMEVTKKAIQDCARTNLRPGQTLKFATESIIGRVQKLGGSKRPETSKPTEFVVSPDGKAKKASNRRKAS